MTKNKSHKYERVKLLSNVTFSVQGEILPPDSYPWYNERYKGMERVLELGCGKGEHSLAFAANNANRLCVGIDYKSDRICIGAEKAIAEGLENVLFLRVRIERIREFFVDHSIDEIWLTFPDPHPKKRAIKYRLTSSPFLDAYAQLLTPGGVIHLKTDCDMLYNYSRDSVIEWGGRIVTESDNIHREEQHPLGASDIISKYEIIAQSQGVSVKYMAFTLN